MAFIAYTIGDLIDDALIYLKRIVVTSSIGRKEIRVLLKEAFQVAYEESIMAEPTFYTKSLVFTATTSIPYPAHYRSTLCVRITDVTCKTKGARKVELDEWQLFRANLALQDDANDPIYQEKATGIELQPSLAGILYYLWTLDEAALLDDTTDVNTLIPRPMVPPLLLKILELARVRHFPTEELPSNMIKMLEAATNTSRSITTFLKPVEQSEMEGPAPTYAVRK